MFIEKNQKKKSPVRDDMLAYIIHYLHNLIKSAKKNNKFHTETILTEKQTEYTIELIDISHSYL